MCTRRRSQPTRFAVQSNNSAGLSSGWATKPSSDMHMWVSTLAMPDTTRLAPPTHRPAMDISGNVLSHLRRPSRAEPAFGGRSFWPGGRAILGQPLSNERIEAATDFFLGASLDPIGVTVSVRSATPGMNSIG